MTRPNTTEEDDARLDSLGEKLDEIEARIERRHEARQEAYNRIDEDELPTASRILWIDDHEAYIVCEECRRTYDHFIRSGFTRAPPEETVRLRETLAEKIAEKKPCEICRGHAIIEVANDLLDDDSLDGFGIFDSEGEQ